MFCRLKKDLFIRLSNACSSRDGLRRNGASPQGTAGRDHHPYAFSMFLAGGGIRGGYVHGRTDEIGWAPVEEALHVGDLHATMLHLFGLDHRRLSFPYQGLEQRLTTVARQSHVEPKLLA